MYKESKRKKIILITGVSGGLGSALFKLLIKEDIHIIGVAKNVGRLESLKNSIVAGPNSSFDLISIDLKDMKNVKDLAEEILMNWGALDILVHCAAISAPMSPSSTIFESNFACIFWASNKVCTRVSASETFIFDK